MKIKVSGLLDRIAQRFLSLRKFEFLAYLSSGKVDWKVSFFGRAKSVRCFKILRT